MRIFRLPLGMAIALTSTVTAAQALFTDAPQPVEGQASSGGALYAQGCVACHGIRLEGSPFAPALVGEPFMARWRGKPAAELQQRMRETMPPKPMSPLPAAAYPDLLAFLVDANLHGPPQIAAALAPAAAAAPPTTRISRAARRRLADQPAATDQALTAPADGDWPIWRRTYDANGFSPLREINRDNVGRLREAWSLKLPVSTNEITPLVHAGVLYVYSGTRVLAVDAAKGKTLWSFDRPLPARGQRVRPPTGMRPPEMQFGGDAGQRARVRAIAVQGHSLFVPTPDGHLVALDTRTGQLVWDRPLTDAGTPTGLQLSSGPIVVRGTVIIGVSLGLGFSGGCYIVGLDAATGTERWRFQTIARPGTPGGDTWNGAPVGERFGAGIWTTGSYDAALDLVFFGVGNTYTTATLLQPRTGATAVSNNDGLYTDASLALRPDTGELVWYQQHHRRDVWDQDWAFEQTIATIGRGSDSRRVIVTSGKPGVFEVLDAATGRFISATDMGLQNLFVAIDPRTGEKRTNPALEPVPGKTLLLCPSNFGARNWPATALNPASGRLFIPMLESCADFTYQPRSSADSATGGTDMRFSPRPRPDSDGNFGRLAALDIATGKVAWTYRQRMPVASSLVATAGGVVFMGDLDRYFGAWDQNTGEMLWRTRLPAAAESSPITYAVDGRQYVAVVAGGGSHLGTNSRRLVPELADADDNKGFSVVVFALPARR